MASMVLEHSAQNPGDNHWFNLMVTILRSPQRGVYRFEIGQVQTIELEWTNQSALEGTSRG
jgi:hypothetical protein